ncbi:MAG: hypothetical protein M0C28_28075 [Candidatus Moduliflexus flocculans]|nr:hypothetical protein [Candidatus Moduliflexus flocculans]
MGRVLLGRGAGRPRGSPSVRRPCSCAAGRCGPSRGTALAAARRRRGPPRAGAGLNPMVVPLSSGLPGAPVRAPAPAGGTGLRLQPRREPRLPGGAGGAGPGPRAVELRAAPGDAHPVPEPAPRRATAPQLRT